MTNLIVYALACIGLAYIVGWSEISYAIRQWLAQRGPIGRWIVSGIECPVCFGTWTGIAAGIFLNPLGIVGPIWWAIGVTALATAGSNLLLATLIGLTVPGADK
jgi:hypothetical protein